MAAIGGLRPPSTGSSSFAQQPRLRRSRVWSSKNMSVIDLKAETDKLAGANRSSALKAKDLAGQTADLERMVQEVRQTLLPVPTPVRSVSRRGQQAQSAHSPQLHSNQHACLSSEDGMSDPPSKQAAPCLHVDEEHQNRRQDVRNILSAMNEQEELLRSYLDEMPKIERRLATVVRRYQHFQWCLEGAAQACTAGGPIGESCEVASPLARCRGLPLDSAFCFTPHSLNSSRSNLLSRDASFRSMKMSEGELRSTKSRQSSKTYSPAQSSSEEETDSWCRKPPACILQPSEMITRRTV
mmetsp:Transcript_44837/g.80677  ORF Transcript_44837/g.80677 Transcript_44837/m.80677 type:complete len:297 (-) Transcript_44837:91-981(-)